jgi:hypothetical protein
MKNNEISIINKNLEINKEENNNDISKIKNSEQENIDPQNFLSINDNKKNFGIDINSSNFYNKKTELPLEKEDDKNKEFFINHPIIYFFIKILLLFEGQITRILMQIGDLYIIGIITNIYLEIIIIQLCGVAESNAVAVIFGFI